MSIGSKIADARKEKNLTQEQLADMMSVTRQSISRWESDLSYPEMEKVVLLSEVLDVSCDYLLNDSYDRSKPGTVGKSSVTRLLYGLKGKTVKLTLFETDYEIVNAVCTIIDFDGPWMSVEFQKSKKTMMKILPVSSIQSISIVK
ncbi:MAG: helix-turn-helix transcriptional regulator [Clostridiaceae bacterium]|nr:helix-turn-helix transcriptional regulator [Clostridiaceae bacterium]